MKMPTFFLSAVLFITLLSVRSAFAQTATKSTAKISNQYVCSPCGSNCDNQLYNKPGQCPHCHMRLIKKASVKFKSIDPSGICSYIKANPGVVLLDVRTKHEFEGKANPDFGTLKGAINIPVQELENRLSGISDLKDKEIIVFCSHSHRSPRASQLLTDNGFTNVTNLSGGMSVMTDSSCKK